MLSLQNPFSSMTQLAEERIRKFPVTQFLDVSLPTKILERCVLKHHHRTDELMSRLGPETCLHIGVSGNDALINRKHSERLREIAERNGLTVSVDLFPGAVHAGIPPVEFAGTVLRYGDAMRARRGAAKTSLHHALCRHHPSPPTDFLPAPGKAATIGG
jgi:hypothetical protein